MDAGRFIRDVGDDRFGFRCGTRTGERLRRLETRAGKIPISVYGLEFLRPVSITGRSFFEIRIFTAATKRVDGRPAQERRLSNTAAQQQKPRANLTTTTTVPRYPNVLFNDTDTNAVTTDNDFRRSLLLLESPPPPGADSIGVTV